MVTRHESAATQANVTLTTAELALPSMDWLVGDVHINSTFSKLKLKCGLKLTTRKSYATLGILGTCNN